MNRIISTQSYRFRPLRRFSQPITDHVHDPHINPFYTLWKYKILDPGSEIVAHWNHIFLITCIIALFIDPLYFFVPYIIASNSCMDRDQGFALLITCFRSFADLFFMLHMAMKFRTAFVAPSSRVFGRGELVMDSHQIAIRYLKSDFVMDLAAMLPLPQIVMWSIIPAAQDIRDSSPNNTTLALMLLIQYFPRWYIIFPLKRRIVKTTGIIAKTAWEGAAYNLLLFILASHILGSSWYLLSMGRQYSCWQSECRKESTTCLEGYLDCRYSQNSHRNDWIKLTRVFSNCDARNSSIEFQFGIFADAFTNNVASAKFLDKYFYCLWWGLRNLSSYGQNLATTTYIGETIFCVAVCILGLLLFALLIGDMQTYLQSMSVRLEEWRVRRRDTEEWMRHRQLPPHIQERVRRFVQYKWLATRGVDEEYILQSLPLDLRREIQRHLCLGLVRRVPFFSQMDDQLLDAICERLVSSLSIQETHIVREGDPVNEMLFIIRGQLESSTTNGGRSGFFNSITLKPGDFCGEELLTWALMPNSALNLPSSTRTVKTVSEVEAFALRAEDLKFVANQFRRLHSKKLQHAFRYYSHQWRTWGACYIQAAWRRFNNKKMAAELYKQESSSYLSSYDDDDDDDGDGSRSAETSSLLNHPGHVQNFGVTILASKFAANTRRGANHKGPIASPLPKMFKPQDPDFFDTTREDE